jgi:hypothetical protein
VQKKAPKSLISRDAKMKPLGGAARSSARSFGFFWRDAYMALRWVSAAFALAFASAAFAQTPSVTLRGTIVTVSADGGTLGVKTRSGEAATVRVKPDLPVALVVPATLGDVKPGSFIGVAAVPGDGGALKALEVHIFPEALRGTGEGYRPFDLAPGSSMTNGALSARVDGVEGPTLTVTYHGGQQTIRVDSKTPIVGFEPGSHADLKPGAAMIARGARAEDGAVEATRIIVGKDGLVPPM